MGNCTQEAHIIHFPKAGRIMRLMSEEQKKFDALMQRVIKVSPEELKRRIAAKKIIKKSQGGTKKTKS